MHLTWGTVKDFCFPGQRSNSDWLCGEEQPVCDTISDPAEWLRSQAGDTHPADLVLTSCWQHHLEIGVLCCWLLWYPPIYFGLGLAFLSLPIPPPSTSLCPIPTEPSTPDTPASMFFWLVFYHPVMLFTLCLPCPHHGFFSSYLASIPTLT